MPITCFWCSWHIGENWRLENWIGWCCSSTKRNKRQRHLCALCRECAPPLTQSPHPFVFAQFHSLNARVNGKSVIWSRCLLLFLFTCCYFSQYFFFFFSVYRTFFSLRRICVCLGEPTDSTDRTVRRQAIKTAESERTPVAKNAPISINLRTTNKSILFLFWIFLLHITPRRTCRNRPTSMSFRLA